MKAKKKRRTTRRRAPVGRKVDPIEREVDRLLASIREPLIAGIRDLVAHGVRYQLDTLLDAIDKRVVAIN